MDIRKFKEHELARELQYRGIMEMTPNELAVFLRQCVADSQLKGMDKKWAFNLGAMFVRALQGDYDLVNYYAKEIQIDFKDGKPYCPTFSAHALLKPLDKEGIKSAIEDWLSCGESRLTPDEVDEIAEAIYYTFGTFGTPPAKLEEENKRLREA